MNRKVTVVGGAGNVGATVARGVADKSLADVVVIDIADQKAAGVALDILETEPEWIERLWDNTRFFKAGLESQGFNTGMSESPITPVIAGEGAKAMELSDKLFERGVFAQGIAFPTVARDKARVRTIVTATHTREDLQFALDAFAAVGRQIGLI